MMKEIDTKDTEILLSLLDNEIINKCSQIKKQRYEENLKKTFFISCCLFLLIFILQAFLRILNVSFFTSYLLYQSLIMIVIVPMLFKTMRGVVLK
jgi:hypothetical protein